MKPFLLNLGFILKWLMQTSLLWLSSSPFPMPHSMYIRNPDPPMTSYTMNLFLRTDVYTPFVMVWIRNALHWLMHWNIWSPVGGTVWEGHRNLRKCSAPGGSTSLGWEWGRGSKDGPHFLFLLSPHSSPLTLCFLLLAYGYNLISLLPAGFIPQPLFPWAYCDASSVRLKPCQADHTLWMLCLPDNELNPLCSCMSK